MKKVSVLFAAAAILLSDVMCAVVAFDYRDMLCGIAYSCCSAPAYVAFFEAIPLAVGIAVCVAAACVLRRKAGD